MLEAWRGIGNPITVLLICMLLGLLLGRQKILNREFNKSVSFLLLRVSLPSLILVSMQRPFQPATAVLAGWAFGISFLMYLCLFFVAWAIVTPFRDSREHQGIYRFVLMFSNVGFMGYPLMESLWGRDSIFVGALFNINFNLFMFSLGIWILTRYKPAAAFPWREIFLNPSLLSTIFGFACFLCSWTLPDPIYLTLDTLGGLTTPLSMILVGSLLAQSSLRQVWLDRKVWFLTAIRLVGLPLLVGLALAPWPQIPREISRLAILIAAMPAAANASLMAAEYTDSPEIAGKIVFVSTSVSFLSIPILIYSLGLL